MKYKMYEMNESDSILALSYIIHKPPHIKQHSQYLM
jgi:hypothetical protein